jgi:hypothetical protein
VNWSRTVAGAIVTCLAASGYYALAPEPVSARHVPITTKIVFNREIAQIFQKKCFQCHTDGNVGVPLTTYKEARPWAVAIKEEILERKMPPWSAASGYGHFANDMSLTAREISLILSWTDGGAPSGVLLADEDKQPVYVPSLTSWEQGEPDEIVKVAETVKVAANAPFRVDRIEINTGLKQAKWLRSLQLNPADRRVIRYAAIYDARTGRWLGTWTPSHQVSTQPENFGFQLAPNSKLVMEIGYRGHPDGDGSGAADLGLYFLAKPARPSTALVLTSAPLTVGAGKTRERVRAETIIKSATSATELWPNLGSGARTFEVTAIRPDGTVEPMLWLNNYRADWPTSYRLKEPVALPAGTRLVLTAFYDNPGDAQIQAKPALHVVTAPTSRQPATHAP